VSMMQKVITVKKARMMKKKMSVMQKVNLISMFRVCCTRQVENEKSPSKEYY
jgi:predicted DNA-binding ribbon-helix-helix protein